MTTNIKNLNVSKNMNKKIFISTAILSLIAISFISVANAQSFEPLRYKPEIQEDQFIVCSKDVSNTEYRNQVSCVIVAQDDYIKNQQLRDELYQKTQSLDDTFEMGLID